ncbi:MAG: alpha/beta hydrolase [Candidatus Poseidoniales archaeon]
MINLPQFVTDRKRLFLSISVVLVLLLPAIWFGLGHVIAKQALTVPHGCGLWESNTPTNWTVDDDWESFEPWADSEQRISMRKDFNATSWQFDSYETINFTSRDGINLEGWYVEVNSSSPVVIFVHGGYENGKCKPEILLSASYLSKNNINVFMIDLRNHGHSEVVSDYFYLGQKEYLDVLGAYDWLVEDKSYNPQSIGIVSISTYALASTLAFDESEIGAMWLDSPIIDFPLLVGNELERLGFPRMLASPAITMGERLVGVNIDDKVPLEVASRAGDRPMYLVHGDSDVRISNEHSKKFYNKAVEAEANVTLWLVEDSAHVDALWQYSSDYESRIVTFFTDSLIIES